MDGLVLVLAVILNPRANRRARRADPTERVETPGGENHGGVMETVMPVTVIQQDREKDAAP